MSLAQQFQQRGGPAGAIPCAPFGGQQPMTSGMHTSKASAAQSSSHHHQQQQQRGVQNPNSCQINGVSSHFLGATTVGNQPQFFPMPSQNQSPSVSAAQPWNPGAFQSFYQTGFSPHTVGVGTNSTNSSQLVNNFTPNPNMNIYASILGMKKQPGSAHSTQTPSRPSASQNLGLGNRSNPFQQQSPHMIGQEAMAKYAAQFPGLEPTPIRNTPQQQSGGSTGTPLLGQSRQLHNSNEPNQTLGQDFFSPTPIHPNHQLNRMNLQQQQQLQQQSPMGTSPPFQQQRVAYPPKNSQQFPSGFNPQTGQFSQHQR